MGACPARTTTQSEALFGGRDYLRGTAAKKLTAAVEFSLLGCSANPLSGLPGTLCIHHNKLLDH